MNRIDVMRLAGRELDVTVGTYVMDLHAPPWLFPHYSSTWEGGQLVSERMQHEGWTFRCCSTSVGYVAWFEKKVQPIQRPEDERPDLIYSADADSLPLAISRAALLAVKGIM